MTLTYEDVMRIKEALIMTAHYTGDNEYTKILEKINVIEREEKWKEKEKRK